MFGNQRLFFSIHNDARKVALSQQYCGFEHNLVKFLLLPDFTAKFGFLPFNHFENGILGTNADKHEQSFGHDSKIEIPIEQACMKRMKFLSGRLLLATRFGFIINFKTHSLWPKMAKSSFNNSRRSEISTELFRKSIFNFELCKLKSIDWITIQHEFSRNSDKPSVCTIFLRAIIVAIQRVLFKLMAIQKHFQQLTHTQRRHNQVESIAKNHRKTQNCVYLTSY